MNQQFDYRKEALMLKLALLNLLFCPVVYGGLIYWLLNNPFPFAIPPELAPLDAKVVSYAIIFVSAVTLAGLPFWIWLIGFRLPSALSRASESEKRREPLEASVQLAPLNPCIPGLFLIETSKDKFYCVWLGVSSVLSLNSLSIGCKTTSASIFPDIAEVQPVLVKTPDFAGVVICSLPQGIAKSVLNMWQSTAYLPKA